MEKNLNLPIQKQILQVLVFFFLNANLSVTSVTFVANKF